MMAMKELVNMTLINSLKKMRIPWHLILGCIWIPSTSITCIQHHMIPAWSPHHAVGPSCQKKVRNLLCNKLVMIIMHWNVQELCQDEFWVLWPHCYRGGDQRVVCGLPACKKRHKSPPAWKGANKNYFFPVLATTFTSSPSHTLEEAHMARAE